MYGVFIEDKIPVNRRQNSRILILKKDKIPVFPFKKDKIPVKKDSP
jgi:hypothetical protein